MKSVDLLGSLNGRAMQSQLKGQGWVHRYQHLFSGPKWPSSRKLHKLHVSAAVKTTSRKQVACSRTLIAKPGQEEALEALCKEIVSFSKARMADTKTGLVAFECSKDMFEPNTYHFWEVYESNLALGKHSTLPELKQFMEKTNDMLVGPIGMALYEYKGGKLGAVSVQGGPKGEGGLDDATGASGAAGGASYKQTSSTVDLTSIKEEDNKGLWGIKFKLPWMK